MGQWRYFANDKWDRSAKDVSSEDGLEWVKRIALKCEKGGFTSKDHKLAYTAFRNPSAWQDGGRYQDPWWRN